MKPQVRVEGLAELRRALRKVEDPTHLAELRDGLKRAADIVVDDAQPRARRFSRRAAETIRSRAGGNRAFVMGGKSALRWYGWADFGSRTPVVGNPRSVGPWKGSGLGPTRGRFIYPALDAKERQVTDAVGDAMDKATRKAGLT